MTIATLTAVAALATAGIAAYQVHLLRKQMKEDARPYVVADVVPGFHGGGSWDLTLHSTGRSTARKVRITTEPEPDTWNSTDPDDHITKPLVAYLAAERVLPPGARHRVMWRRAEEGRPWSGAPSVSTVTVAYEDDSGKPYSESFAFDTDLLAEVSPIPSPGARKGESEEGRELMNIDRAIRNLAQHVGELRR